MQFYSVEVRVKRIIKAGEHNVDVYENLIYTNVYAVSAEQAVTSIINQKKVKPEDIIEVFTEIGY